MSGYAVTGAVLGLERLINYAINCAKFLKRHMFDVASGRLMRTCYAGSGGTVEHRWGPGQSGKAGLPGCARPVCAPLLPSRQAPVLALPSAHCELLTSLGPFAHLGNGLIGPTREVDFEG